MRRLVPILCITLAVLAAGCIGPSATGGPSDTPTPTATDTDAPSSTQTPEDVSLSYDLRSGEVASDVRSVNVTLQVVLVEDEGDMAKCWRETFYGPYKPTPTPIGTPEGECHRTEPVTVTLTGDERHSLGPYAAPGTFDAGHALIVTNVSATFENGTAVSPLVGTGGHRAAVVAGEPDGEYAVELGLTRGETDSSRFYLASELVETPE